METQIQRFLVALTGAFLVGCISSYVIFSTVSEGSSNSGLLKNDRVTLNDDIQTTPLVSEGLVYSVKRIVLSGWNDVINPRVYHTLLATECVSDTVISSNGVECATSTPKLNKFIISSEKSMSHPVIEVSNSCNILHTLVSEIIYNRLAFPFVREVPWAKAIRCRGPATGWDLCLAAADTREITNIV